MATAEPVFSNTHHASAMRYRLSPSREVVCPNHKSAKGRCVNERRIFIVREYSMTKEMPENLSRAYSAQSTINMDGYHLWIMDNTRTISVIPSYSSTCYLQA